jgi:hypothetical protein
VSPSLFTASKLLCREWYLSIQKDFLLFLLEQECRSWDCFSISLATVKTVNDTSVLILFLIVCFCIWLAIEDHLLPSFELFKHVNYISEHAVLCAWRVHKCSMRQTILLKHLLLFISDPKCLDTSFIFKFKTCFGCSVLDGAEHLQDQLWVLNITTVPTDVFILDVCVTNVTLILDLYKWCFNDKS